MNIKNNIINLTQNLPSTCKLVAVTKTQPLDKIMEAYSAGHRIFGENKAQELAQKHEALPKDIEWHMIGHLQTNKVKYIAAFVHLIHSADSLKLLEEINKQAMKYSRTISCLLQIHIAEEETKYGFSQEEATELLESNHMESLTHVHINGLMGMATFTSNQEKVKMEFRNLKSLFEKLKRANLSGLVEMKELSMGMSNDYPLALEEGSTLIRVGSAIFGERQQH